MNAEIKQKQEQDQQSFTGENVGNKLDHQKMIHEQEEEEEENMQSALAEVVQLRALLRRLGECPDEQSVNLARRRIIGIDYRLSSGTLPLPAREVAKQLRSSYRSVIKLNDMYLAYQKLLHDAELRLDHIRQGRICRLKKNGDINGNEAIQEEDPCLDNACAVNGVTGMVEHLELCAGGLQAFPKQICKAVCLVSLNLSKNVLASVPEAIGELVNLEKLDLHHNLLELLPETLGLLQKLKVLNVSYNRLRVLPDGLDMCMDLVELNAAYNELRYVPAHFGYKMVKLEVLLLGNNKLTSLPSCVGAMIALVQLEVQFNHLACLPPNIGCLRKLKLLNVSGNFSDMVSLPDSIGDLIELEEIQLRDNQITELPYSFGALQNLKRIDLEHNPLTVPPMEVVGEGIDAVKEFMAKRWVEYLVEQEKRVTVSRNGHLAEETGWNWFSAVFGGSNMNNSVLNEYR